MNIDKKITTKKLVTLALLIGIEIILSRFLSIATPLVKIGFAFLPLSIIALLYGPGYSAIAAAIADFLGAILFPIASFFPGFTVTAFISGLTYGLFLYKKPKKFLWLASCVIVVSFIELILNTFNIYLLSGQAFRATLPIRLIQCAIMIPMKIITIWNVGYFLADIQRKISADAIEKEYV